MTNSLLMAKSTRERLADFLVGRTKPPAFDSLTWRELVQGTKSALPLPELQQLVNAFPGLLVVIDWPPLPRRSNLLRRVRAINPCRPWAGRVHGSPGDGALRS